jgi:hypothetical protein
MDNTQTNNRPATLAGLGFKGATDTSPSSAFKSLSAQSSPTTANPAATGLLQQAVLWNVRYFSEKKINYSPLFVTAAEDSSLTKYLGKAVCQAYTCTIMKATLQAGEHDESKIVNNIRTQLLVLFSKKSSTLSIQYSGPKSDEAAKANTLGELLTYSSIAKQKESADLTISKAVEQILAKALEDGLYLPATTFQFDAPTVTLQNE